jgi:diaminopimelate decarboxylase
MGGGIGIPYKPEQEAMDLQWVSSEIKQLYERMIVAEGLDPLRIVFECGRMVTGPYGNLVTKVRHVTQKYKRYVGLDASMANLMRPATLRCVPPITVVGKKGAASDGLYDVTGRYARTTTSLRSTGNCPTCNRETWW